MTGKEVATWVGLAEADYLAARSLLLPKEPPWLMAQGVGLANTAVEKYLKTIIGLRNLKIKKTHQVDKLYNELLPYEPRLKINEEFLRFLSKAYLLRYPDDLLEGFNISIVQSKTLTELDETIYKIAAGLVIVDKTTGKRVQTLLDECVAKKDPRLMELNVAFGGCIRSEVFSALKQHYEIRILSGGTILEAQYLAEGIADDRNFMAEALKPSGDKSFSLCASPK